MKENRKYFFMSMSAIFYIFALLIGFVVAEKNTRAIGFGDSSPFFVYQHKNYIPKLLKIHFMGKDFILNF